MRTFVQILSHPKYYFKAAAPANSQTLISCLHEVHHLMSFEDRLDFEREYLAKAQKRENCHHCFSYVDGDEQPEEFPVQTVSLTPLPDRSRQTMKAILFIRKPEVCGYVDLSKAKAVAQAAFDPYHSKDHLVECPGVFHPVICLEPGVLKVPILSYSGCLQRLPEIDEYFQVRWDCLPKQVELPSPEDVSFESSLDLS